jgi:hypothetical protein
MAVTTFPWLPGTSSSISAVGIPHVMDLHGSARMFCLAARDQQQHERGWYSSCHGPSWMGQHAFLLWG